MTPKEKAKELVDKYVGFKLTDYNDPEMSLTLFKAKQHALICVDEIQQHAQMIEGGYEGYSSTHAYFVKVRQEINKL